MRTPFTLQIAGHGLAGACVAWGAIERGWKVEVQEAEERSEAAASRVAGGIASPVGGRFFTETWRGAEFFGASRDFFHAIARRAGQDFWRDLPTDWAFDDEGAREAFRKRSRPGCVEYSADQIGCAFPSPLRAELGGARVSPSAFVDLPAFLDWSREALRELGAWVNPLPASSPTTPRVRCLGRWETGAWDWRRTRGECVDLELGSLPKDRIWKRKLALIPLEQARFRASATFENSPSGAEPTAAGLAALERALERQIGALPKLTHHRAGLRTHSPDHRPVVGPDPERANEWILNGLGSKGVLWAPLASRWLLDAIETGRPESIPAECHSGRLAVIQSRMS